MSLAMLEILYCKIFFHKRTIKIIIYVFTIYLFNRMGTKKIFIGRASPSFLFFY